VVRGDGRPRLRGEAPRHDAAPLRRVAGPRGRPAPRHRARPRRGGGDTRYRAPRGSGRLRLSRPPRQGPGRQRCVVFPVLLPRSSGRLRISGRCCCGSRSILVGVGSGDHSLHFRSELLMGSIISFVMAPFALQDGTSLSLTNLRWTPCYILTLVSVLLIPLVHFICIALCHGFCLLGAVTWLTKRAHIATECHKVFVKPVDYA
jgi:hypothetical protein